MNIVYMFPGQGSQFIGMGKGLFEKYPDIVQQANSLLGYSIEELCLIDEKKRLNQTSYTQPAIYVIEVLSYLEHLSIESLPPDYVLGHSLGEYAALFAAGCFDFMTGLQLVKMRSQFMSQSVEGGMAAVLGIKAGEIETLLQDSLQFSEVTIANFNTPHQTVLSGNKSQLKSLSQHIIAMGGKYYPLNVSGAFHSPYMASAQQKFEDYIRSIDVKPPVIPVIANVNARRYPDSGSEIKSLLIQQITHSVCWQESIYHLKHQGVDRFIEIGPGKTLTRMLPDILEASTGSTKSKNNVARHKPLSPVLLVCPDIEDDSVSNLLKYHLENTQFLDGFKQCLSIGRPLVEMPVDDLCSGKIHISSLSTSQVYLLYLSVGISLGLMPKIQNQAISAYLGRGLGEYIALVLSGVLSKQDAITLLIKQARLMEFNDNAISTLIVYTNVNIFYGFNKVFNKTRLIGTNSYDSFSVVGDKTIIDKLFLVLQENKVTSYISPLKHSPFIEKKHESKLFFEKNSKTIVINKPNSSFYSSALQCQISDIHYEDLWRMFSSRFNFFSILKNIYKTSSNIKTCNLYETQSLGVMENGET